MWYSDKLFSLAKEIVNLDFYLKSFVQKQFWGHVWSIKCSRRICKVFEGLATITTILNK